MLSINTFVLVPLWERSAEDKAALLTLTANSWVELHPERRAYFETEIYTKHGLILTEDKSATPTRTSPHHYYRTLASELEKRVGEPVEVMEGEDMLWVDVPTESGFSLRVEFLQHLPHVQQFYVGLSLLGVVLVVVLIISFTVTRRISKPLTQVADAATAFRGGAGFTPLPETGIREFVSLSKSFNEMAEEISTLLTNRTTLTAGISHDLRTPLTRMMLALELLPDNVDPNLIERFRTNLNSMESLIADAAFFAKGETETTVRLDVDEFIASTVHSVDESIKISREGNSPGRTSIARSALKRCLSNLVENARRHAKGARLLVRYSDEGMTIHVLDDGPGIPEPDRQRVLQPFVRLEESRNVETGGSGLGLAIVAQLCQIHGWNIDIGESSTGGTDATLRVPFETSRLAQVR